MAVKFCIVARDPAESAAIASVAKPLADLNPQGREILRKGEVGFPSDDDVARWAHDNKEANPGSVTLRADGTFSSILSIADSKIGAMIEGAFTDAA